MSATAFAQRGTGSNPAAAPTTTVSFASVPAITNKFVQQYLVWTNPEAGASNKVAWGLSRNAWTNGTALTLTNRFPITNGWHYKVTSMFSGVEAVPALWPSNRFDRIWVQTSTNLTTWKDGFIWQTNYNKPQEFLRLRAETIKWE